HEGFSFPKPRIQIWDQRRFGNSGCDFETKTLLVSRRPRYWHRVGDQVDERRCSVIISMKLRPGADIVMRRSLYVIGVFSMYIPSNPFFRWLKMRFGAFVEKATQWIIWRKVDILSVILLP